MSTQSTDQLHAENRALWLPSPGGRFSVGAAPLTPPAPNELVVRVHAVALNFVDTISGLFRRLVIPRLPYPAVIGSDVAGQVVAVGDAITRFAVGDRVLGHATGQDRTRNRAAEGAFQLYVVLVEHMTSTIPDSLPYEQASVLPLTLSTASAGLFERDQLALALPHADATARGETVLVWGGSTSVGNNAIQLVRNAGYDVIATASPRNFDNLKLLGAERCFDRNDDAAVRDIVAYLRGRHLAGTLAIGIGSLGKAVKIAARSEGTKRVSTTYPGLLAAIPARIARRHGVRVTGIWGGTPIVSEVGPAIYADFLPAALRDGRFVAAPAAEVVGHGLEAIPEALRLLKGGVGARKLVVTVAPAEPPSPHQGDA